MRHAFEEIREALAREPNPDALMPKAERWFGPPNQAGGGNRKNPGGSFDRHNTRIFFTDFVHDGPLESEWRRRIALNENRHAADEQMMQLLESPIPAGKNVDFVGTITFDAGNETRDFVQYRIIKALRWAGCVGANTSVGFGHLSDLKVDPIERTATGTLALEKTGEDSIELCLTTDQPLCITETRGAENLFESGIEIPGGVLKGAIASQWMRPGHPLPPELATYFDRVRVTHARPIQKGNTDLPVTVPLSLGEVAAGYRDFALDPAPPNELGEVVAFSRDWKGDPSPLFGWPKVEKELRVRTAIDRARGRARDKDLFAYEMVRPQGLEWHCTVSLGEVPEAAREAVGSQLLELIRDGIQAVGKTKASLKAKIATPKLHPKYPSKPAPSCGKFIISLQTAALLVDTQPLTGSRDPKRLLQAYRKVFDEFCGDCLQLSHFFVLHRLRGGLYLYKRFQEGRVSSNGQPAPYEPYLLTQAGSVFVLTVESEKEAAAREIVNHWCSFGLDTPKWARERFARAGQDGAHWSNNPYIRQNGCGEIAVNLEFHFSREVLHA